MLSHDLLAMRKNDLGRMRPTRRRRHEIRARLRAVHMRQGIRPTGEAGVLPRALRILIYRQATGASPPTQVDGSE